jgi:hypothetical protein
MSFVSILVPLAIGVLLLAFPEIFSKAKGEAFVRAKRKLKTVGFVLIGVATLYFFVKISELSTGHHTPAPDGEMHRLQATTPAGSGWYLAKSTHGSFSVQLPVPFNDFTMSGNDPKLGALKTYCVGAQMANGIKFSATEIPMVPGMTSPDLNRLPATLGDNDKKVFDVVNASVAGWPAISFSVEGSGSGGFMRYVKTKSSLFVMILEYPRIQQLSASQLKSRFLDSLEFQTPVETP